MTSRDPLAAVTAQQHAASDPARSAWVSANAGAGKTHVLSQRVIRLLLDGTDPAKILCLTFTKAAAANMANRIFETLGAWIALDDAALDAAIRATGAKQTNAAQRARARRLFAAALETPGGLKVQTIHAFCTRVLQQFPFEANVPARFRVLEENEQRQMLEQLRRGILLEAASDPASATGRALGAIVGFASDHAFHAALSETIRERGRIAAWLEDAGSIDRVNDQLSQALGLKPEETLEAVEAEILDGPHLPSKEWASVAAICAKSPKNDRDHSKRLMLAEASSGLERLEAYLSVFFNQDGEARKRLLTKDFAAEYTELAHLLDREKLRLESLCEKRRAIVARDRSVALMTLAAALIESYRDEKNRRGLLDYDDLIGQTRALLERVDAAWVHYKLDLGIDHLLIDEAQDTSPAQWDIIKRFVAEFTAGAGARSGVRRSIFAVGDDKQSIFSFQGAVPDSFAGMRRFFAKAFADAALEFLPVELKHSFRSVPAVLEAIDTVFRSPAAHAGLTADPVPTLHEAVRAAAPGLVELWPLEEPEARSEAEAWDAPFDITSSTHPRVKLARRIAGSVKTWLGRGDAVGDGPQRHPLRASDILVLVRQRGALFEAIIRALKQQGIAVAGADRLVLTEHIAIMDLLVLADALLHPPDDLALATVLRSPLFGLSDDELFDLAHGRRGTLRAALTARRPDLAARLDALAAAARRQPPFAFYAELLGAGGGRRAFLARLGAEVNDALDEFLTLALDYERRETPSLQGFVAWLRTASAEIKRDMELTRDEVRVMTVHGAKGLEAPVVILADTTTPPAGQAQHQPRLLPLNDAKAPPDRATRFVWVPTKKDDTAATAAARAASIAANESEYRRLLYVGMTRAADRLVVCGARGEKAVPAGCWYELVRSGLEAGGLLVEEKADFGGGAVWRYRKSADEGAMTAPRGMTEANHPLPSWLQHEAPGALLRPAAISPSTAYDGLIVGTVRSRAAEGERAQALARGILVHRLLQSLPELPRERRENAARRYLDRHAQALAAEERESLTARILALLDDARFAPLFAPGSRAEVPIVGRIGSPARRVTGQVDRLAVTPESVLIADYKSNRPVPAAPPEAYVAQLALYRAVLLRLFPDRPVRAALVWTETPDIVEISSQALDAALAAWLGAAAA
ncbi:MAG TPA: double-strand break repair helicase AddA [Xanthobacteraceae bacterium]|nr:double-strand break repair helicase AddA [Xanthobacteraceae bacterium]